MERKETYKYNDLKKDAKVEDEYDNFANQDFEFRESTPKEDVDSCIEQEIFNFKVERIVGIEKDKQEFDDKYKESLVKYINNHSYKNKSNTGTIIGMTVFGIMGFIIFSGTIYLSVIGSVIGIGVGRLVGSRFKSRLRYQSLDQRLIFEMKLVIKWAKQERKNKKLDDKCLILLIETILMNTSYLLEKVNLKKVCKFFKVLSKFLIDEDRKQCFLNNMPHARDLRSKDENYIKKEMYKLFNFYIPLTRILEGGDFGKLSHKDTKLFRKLYAYVTSDDV
jgi:hypothetical protein